MTEPLPPDITTLADRLYSRLPGVYRQMDLNQAWLLKRYVGAVCQSSGEVDDLVERLRGARPVGPAVPLPWGLDPADLANWVEARSSRPSALSDPDLADAVWLPWLATLVGARLDPSASVAEQRDTIRYATSGWRAGTRGAMADAARSALTGTKYAKVYPHMKSDPSLGLVPGTPWDVTVVTRLTETPDVNAVLGAILRKGVKPAGVTLWHKAYEATWDTWEAVFPTWADWDAATWEQLQEAGLVYAPLTGNLLTNPSFEAALTPWVIRGAVSALTRQPGGVDGAGHARLTATGSGTGEFESGLFAITPGTYKNAFSVRTSAGTTMQFFVQYRDAGNATLSEQGVFVGATTPGVWQRVDLPFTAPALTVTAKIYIQGLTMTVGQYFDIDAGFVRSVP